MLFICYPKCSTCKKAKKWLDEHHLNYTERHIVEKNPSYDELKEWVSKSGLPLKKFFNTSGLLYKEMKLKDKLPTSFNCWQPMECLSNVRWLLGMKQFLLVLRKMSGVKNWNDGFVTQIKRGESDENGDSNINEYVYGLRWRPHFSAK